MSGSPRSNNGSSVTSPYTQLRQRRRQRPPRQQQQQPQQLQLQSLVLQINRDNSLTSFRLDPTNTK
ncbi:unnamed protein product, partial [Closterium sp. NIES-54]